MNTNRRDFLRRTSVFAAGFLSLRSFCAHATDESLYVAPYGPLVEDINGVLELPAGFSYRVVSVSGNKMSDGFFIPGMPDGMASFPGPDGFTVLVRNHELMPFDGPSAFGKSNELFSNVDKSKLFDAGFGTTPHQGGTTTVVYDTKQQKVVSEFLSLAGTSRNCAGGPTPWNSWITCEESVVKTGPGTDGDYQSERDHGYNFEVPATTKMKLHDAVPLTAMGRFYHEAVAIDPQSGIVYETEDRDDGLIYRFLPKEPGKLSSGGKLQVLKFRDSPSLDARNWDELAVVVGKQYAIDWLDVDNVESPEDDLRYRGFEKGAAKFARGEGMWYSDGQVFFASTNGGKAQTGQLWRILPAAQGSSEPDQLELFIEPNDAKILQAADNMTVSPWGDIIICEDHQDEARIMGITPKGTIYPFAKNYLKTEFAGVTFSPDRTTLFVNLQARGMTIAITGPWENRLSS